MTSDTVDYTRAIRSTPDKHAKTAPRPIIGFLTDLLAKILLPPLLLAELPYLIYIKLFKRTAPKWSFSRLVGTNVMRINGMFVSPWLPQPRSQQDQWNIPTDGEPYREAISRGEIDFEIVKLDPVDNKLRKGIADVPAVKGEATPGFWLRPKGSKSDKVILYIHGG
jgi:acetyl esterase/lipase